LRGLSATAELFVFNSLMGTLKPQSNDHYTAIRWQVYSVLAVLMDWL